MKKILFIIIFFVFSIFINSQTERVSIAYDGTEANKGSYNPSISVDGRYVVFLSDASNLVPGDTNNKTTIFVFDRVTRKTTVIGLASDGTRPHYYSFTSSISADGRHIAFSSDASNLVPGDTNNRRDIFLFDQITRKTFRVSVSSDGIQANGSSFNPSISADGRYVAFNSFANNLVPGDTNDASDILMFDRVTKKIFHVSVASDGTQANEGCSSPSISADGKYIAFRSAADNLVPGDTNDKSDIFVFDRITRKTIRVSVASDGTQANEYSSDPSISADGRYIAFYSEANNLVPGDTNDHCDVFVFDSITRKIIRVNVASDGAQANFSCYESSISADGRYITFSSSADNLVPGDKDRHKDIFVHDIITGVTICVSVACDGTQGNYYSDEPSISADGRYVAFHSEATNLVPNDLAIYSDIFVHDRIPVVRTSPVSGITSKTAKCGGNITYDGRETIHACGVCWSTSPKPTTANNHTTDGTSTDSFTCTITGLTKGTTYHVRAFATNLFGTSYGEDLTFTAIKQHTLIVIPSTGGTIKGKSTQHITPGDSTTPVEAIANTGYFFLNWTGSEGFAQTHTNPLTVTHLTDDLTVTANFSQIKILATRLIDKAWIVSNHYGQIRLRVSKVDPSIPIKFVLYRQEPEKEYKAVSEITHNDLKDGSYFFFDTFISENESYNYKVMVYTPNGTLLGSSNIYFIEEIRE